MNISIDTSDPTHVDPAEIAAAVTAAGYLVLSVDVNDGERTWQDTPGPTAAAHSGEGFDPNGPEFRVVSDNHSNHNLPTGAVVRRCEAPDWSDSADWYTQGADGDEVSIDPRDLEPVTDAETTVDRSDPSWPREVPQEHLDADADHPAQGVPDDSGVSDNCGKCGLATTSNGKRHGFDA